MGRQFEDISVKPFAMPLIETYVIFIFNYHTFSLDILHKKNTQQGGNFLSIYVLQNLGFLNSNYLWYNDKHLQWQITHFSFLFLSYPTNMYCDQKHCASVGQAKCFKSKAYTQQTMTWLIYLEKSQKKT
jgi:hypothetical protein